MSLVAIFWLLCMQLSLNWRLGQEQSDHNRLRSYVSLLENLSLFNHYNVYVYLYRCC